MKRRVLTLAAIAPVIAAPMWMMAAEDAGLQTPIERPDRPTATATYQTAALAVRPTPRTELPASPELLELPTLGDSVDQPNGLGTAGAVPPTVAPEDAAEAANRATLTRQIALLQAAATKLRRIDGYTAEMLKQERVDGELRDAERANLKLRHAPFSVYMKWTEGDAGREVLYVEGEHEGDMLVHPGGWRGRFLSTLSVDPRGSLAMSESRHPVTEAGLMNLVEKHLQHKIEDLDAGDVEATIREVEFDGKPARELAVTYGDRERNPVYHRAILLLDVASGLPVASYNHGWTSIDRDGDEATLVERYEYRSIDTQTALGDADFDRGNRRYGFKR